MAMLWKKRFLVAWCVHLCDAYLSLSFQVGQGLSLNSQLSRSPSTGLLDSFLSVDGDVGDDNIDDDQLEEEMEPGKMRVSEIKAELDLRGVEYKDCFDKESLSQRLMEARASGKANPAILEKFNRAKVCYETNDALLYNVAEKFLIPSHLLVSMENFLVCKAGTNIQGRET